MGVGRCETEAGGHAEGRGFLFAILTSAPEGTATGAGSRAFFLSRPQAERGTPLPGADCPGGDIPCSTALSALEGTARRPGPERRTSGAEQNGGRCRGIAGAFSDSVAAGRRRLGRGFRRRDSAEGAPEPSVRKTSFFLPEGTTAGKAGRVQPEGCGAERTPFCGRGVSVGSCRHEVDSGCLCGPVPHECGAWYRAAFLGAVSRPEAGATWGGWPFREGRKVQPMPRRGNEAAGAGLALCVPACRAMPWGRSGAEERREGVLARLGALVPQSEGCLCFAVALQADRLLSR